MSIDHPNAEQALRTALQYLDHPDVHAIPFALPVSNVVRQIKGILSTIDKQPAGASLDSAPATASNSSLSHHTEAEGNPSVSSSILIEKMIGALGDCHIALAIWSGCDSWDEVDDRAMAAIDEATKMYTKWKDGNMLTVHRARKIIKKKLAELELPAYKLSARTISFQDLARDSCIFVKVHGWRPDSKWHQLKATAKQAGFCIES